MALFTYAFRIPCCSSAGASSSAVCSPCAAGTYGASSGAGRDEGEGKGERRGEGGGEHGNGRKGVKQTSHAVHESRDQMRDCREPVVTWCARDAVQSR